MAAGPHYADPFDTTYAQRRGGRWNPGASWPTLYLNEDLPTVHALVRHLFLGRGVEPDDLDDDAPIRVTGATPPRRQRVAEVFTGDGVAAVGLPGTYAMTPDGGLVAHRVTQGIGSGVHQAGLRGVWCRSASGTGRELAWFPAARATAAPVWSRPKPFGAWRHARSHREVV